MLDDRGATVLSKDAIVGVLFCKAPCRVDIFGLGATLGTGDRFSPE